MSHYDFAACLLRRWEPPPWIWPTAVNCAGLADSFARCGGGPARTRRRRRRIAARYLETHQ